MASFKEEHEQFIAGHNGTNYIEAALLTSISCFSCFLGDLIFLSSIGKLFRSRLLTEFILLIFPNILSVSILQSHLALFSLTLMCIIAFLCLFQVRSLKTMKDSFSFVNLDSNKQFVTYFRSVVVLCTAVAILAVDFPVFPRRFAKAETFGFGGMDIGVGLFVVSNAIVSPEARSRVKDHLSIRSHLRRTMVSCAPLFLLGLARLMTVKGIDYPEHTTEYGVHWNFFFTLLVLKVFLSVIYMFVPVNKSAFIGLTVLFLHQSLLSNGLSFYIINGSNGNRRREGLLDANREGIFSLPGYIAIYMFGVKLGCVIFEERKNLTEWLKCARTIAFHFFIYTIAIYVTHSAVEPVSRRLTNAAFVFWVMSISCLMILELLLGDIIITWMKYYLQKYNSDILYDKNIPLKI
ncbi:hypothetical protein Btru_077236 [Bulinus truncatus]|nr:hypothetical protein Btru_077236 [Bulinus truncatus]